MSDLAETRSQGPGWRLRQALRLAARTRLHWSYLPLALIVALGTLQRLHAIDDSHHGDMSVLLSVTFTILSWPPNDYYHDYASQQWVYNHLPAFPLMLSPLYWLAENVFSVPPAWAARALIGVADLVIALLLYRQARGPYSRALGTALAAAWLLSAPVMNSNDHPVSVAVAFALLSAATVERKWLPGLLLALGVATRSEIAFLVIPMALYLLARGGPWRSIRFLAIVTATLGLIAAPFVMLDPAAMDYAMRRQLQRDASDQVSLLLFQLLPYIDLRMETFLQENPSLLAVALNLLIAPLALRDRRAERVLLIAAIAYLVTLPLMYERYTLLALGLGLYYSAVYGSPLVAAIVTLIWVGQGVIADYLLVALFAGLIASSLIDPAGVRLARLAASIRGRAAPAERSAFEVSLVLAVVCVGISYGAASGILPLPRASWTPKNNATVNLITEAKRGRLEVTAPPAADPSEYCGVKTFTLGGKSREVLYMHPPSSVSIEVEIPDRGRLQFAMALDDDVWEQPGDGVEFQVEIESESGPELLYSSYIDPRQNPAHRQWTYASIDLERFEGEEVKLVLRTLPGESSEHDWAGWAVPRLVSR